MYMVVHFRIMNIDNREQSSDPWSEIFSAIAMVQKFFKNCAISYALDNTEGDQLYVTRNELQYEDGMGSQEVKEDDLEEDCI